MTWRARILRTFAALGVIAGVVTVGAVPASAAASITGGGSGFAAPELDQWKADTAVNPYNLTINYVAQGSSFGRVSFSENTLDFGASDIVYPDAEKASAAVRALRRPSPRAVLRVRADRARADWD